MTTHDRGSQTEVQISEGMTGRLQRRVLLIEPDSTGMPDLEGALRSSGCQLEIARGSFEYLPRISVAASRIDVLVLAWEPDGIEEPALAAELRKLRDASARPLVLAFRRTAATRDATGTELVDASMRLPVSTDALRRMIESWELANTFRDAPAGPSLDRDAVADLARLDGGVLLHDLTEVCLQSTQQYVSQAQHAVAVRDARGLREAAHILKGSSGVFGAGRLAGICDALEELGRSGQLDCAAFLLDRLHAEAQSFDAELRMVTQATDSVHPAPEPNSEGIELSQMAATFQGKRVIARGLSGRIAERLGALLFAMDADFRVVPEQAGATEWQLAADLVVVAGDQTDAHWAQCRRLRKQLPRAGMVLVLADATPDSLDRTEELGAEVVASPVELRDLLLRSYQQLQICRRPRTPSIDPPPGPAARAVEPPALPGVPAPPPVSTPAESGLVRLALSVRGDGPLRALVAEDDSLTARFLVSVLEANGFHADHAENGNRAVGMLSVRTYDAVLLDLNMPELDGYGVLSRLRQMTQYQQTPVLVLSARNQERDILRAFSLGASDYVTKPFSPPEVVFRLKRMVERS